MGLYTWTRAGVYRDEETLWRDNLAKNADAWQAHNRLGQIYFNQGRFSDASPHLQRASALKPELADNHNQLGLVYCRLNQFEQGIAEYREALRLKEAKPGTLQSRATIRTNLANALTITANNITERMAAGGVDLVAQQVAMSHYHEAIWQYQEALKLQPRQPAIHRNLGRLLARMGKYPEAIQHLRAVLEIVPNEPNARELLRALEQERPADSQ
jgi:tetratricopeptide (TPR) repeat protein